LRRLESAEEEEESIRKRVEQEKGRGRRRRSAEVFGNIQKEGRDK
jgi:hypothetical protein